MLRITYDAVTDDEAISAFKTLTRLEGIIQVLESSHAIFFFGDVLFLYSK